MAISLTPVTAVYCFQFQNAFDRTVAVSEDNLKNDESHKRNHNFRRKLCNVSKQDKMILRRVKNNEAARASRERAKLHQKFLEEKLSDLQYEKMKLLLEKESLTKRNMELRNENSDLKSKFQNMNSLCMNEEYSCGTAIKHASFVSILLQKEWVVYKIFIVLLVTAWKAINQSLIFLSAVLRNLKSTHKITKLLMPFLSHLWVLMMPVTSFLNNFLLLNG